MKSCEAWIGCQMEPVLLDSTVQLENKLTLTFSTGGPRICWQRHISLSAARAAQPEDIEVAITMNRKSCLVDWFYQCTATVGKSLLFRHPWTRLEPHALIQARSLTVEPWQLKKSIHQQDPVTTHSLVSLMKDVRRIGPALRFVDWEVSPRMSFPTVAEKKR